VDSGDRQQTGAYRKKRRTGSMDWTVKRYQAGDGAWRAEHPTGQIAISLRRGLYVITVSSKDAALAERCAGEIVLYLDAI
jgi:hypothetical protein